jgi:hypothetical protein
MRSIDILLAFASSMSGRTGIAFAITPVANHSTYSFLSATEFAATSGLSNGRRRPPAACRSSPG